MATLTISSTPALGTKADSLVVALSQGDGASAPPRLVTAGTGLGGGTKPTKALLAALTAVGARGRAGEVTTIPAPTGVAATTVTAVGLGPVDRRGPDDEALRRAAGAAVRGLAGRRKVALALPADSAARAGAVAEGALLGAYAFTDFRKESLAGQQAPVASLVLAAPSGRDRAVKAAVARAGVVVQAVALARDLVNTPPSHLPPAVFADRAIAAAKEAGVAATVLDEKALRKGGYGGIMGVGQGSANPPRLLRLEYRPAGATAHLALVGKGITFDTGGISIKPAQGMEAMKSDMGGAAAVIAATLAVARLGLPVQVTAFAPMAENMPSGSAQRPSDVLTTRGGRTVEVLNTDAEGRLIMADALVDAAALEPDLIIDAATLTGAQIIALGQRTSAIMSNDDDARQSVHQASQEAGEAMWPMPLPEELRKGLDSATADIANLGDRSGGMLSAGVFLKEFVPEGQAWVHLDVAGPAYNEGEPWGYTPKGGTGVPVRTLVRVAERMAGG